MPQPVCANEITDVVFFRDLCGTAEVLNNFQGPSDRLHFNSIGIVVDLTHPVAKRRGLTNLHAHRHMIRIRLVMGWVAQKVAAVLTQKVEKKFKICR